MNLKNSGDSTGFEPMTSAMPVQCSDQQFTDIWRRFVSVLAKRFFEKFLKTFKIYFYFTTKLNIAFANEFFTGIDIKRKTLQCRICPDWHEIGFRDKMSS